MENAQQVPARLPEIVVYENLPSPLDGAANMALDEVLLAESERPWLRWYGWAEPTTSIGYFTPRSVLVGREGAPWVRRWTGGGLVEHGTGRDSTFSLGFPRSCEWARMRSAESYRRIHSVLANALAAAGAPCSLAEMDADSAGAACFAGAVAADIVDVATNKIAGGAQRRSREGLLHQGSIQGVEVGSSTRNAFAESLAEEIVTSPLPSGCVERAEALADAKYRQAAWLERA